MDFMELVEEFEDVIFAHETDAIRHGKRRKTTFKNWRRDRKHWKRYPMTDTGFTKRALHKKNRKIFCDPDKSSVTYYKENGLSLSSVCYGLT